MEPIQKRMRLQKTTLLLQLLPKTGLISHTCSTEIGNRNLQPLITTPEWKRCVILRLQNTIIPIKYLATNIITVTTGIFTAAVYATASSPTAYMTNKQLASTAILKVTITEKKKVKVPEPKTTKLTSVKAGKKSLALTWKKITAKTQKKRIKGYQIQYGTKKNFKNAKTKNINGYKKNRATLNRLKSKKKYYIRIRTILKLNGKTYYSRWSKVKSAKVK